jgi:MoxR-like ATPase
MAVKAKKAPPAPVDNGDTTVLAGTVQGKFLTGIREMDASLIERTDEITLVATALIARENALLVGPPGTAKSMLAQAFLDLLGGGKLFTWILNKSTSVEDIFGQLDVIRYARGDGAYVRRSHDKLPEADVAVLDELFRGNSAILNTLLPILNERTWDNGTQRIKLPLKCVISGTNNWAEDENAADLAAFFDRFLLRKTVAPIATEDGLERLLFGTNGDRDHRPKFTVSLSTAELEQAQNEAAALSWTDAAKQAILQIIAELKAQGIHPGDRRKLKSYNAASAYAYVQGAAQVEREHLEILQHVLWDDPAEQPSKCAAVVMRIANPVGLEVNGLLTEMAQVTENVQVKDPAATIAALEKLSEIGRKLAALKQNGGNGRVDKALASCRAAYKRIKLASVETIDDQKGGF